MLGLPIERSQLVLADQHKPADPTSLELLRASLLRRVALNLEPKASPLARLKRSETITKQLEQLLRTMQSKRLYWINSVWFKSDRIGSAWILWRLASQRIQAKAFAPNNQLPKGTKRLRSLTANRLQLFQVTADNERSLLERSLL